MATEPKDSEEAIRVVDDERSAKETRQGDALAKHAGVNIEELDRRMHAEDHKRDAQGLPPLSKAQLAERIAVDDFGKDEDDRRNKDASDPLPGPAAAAKKKDLRSGEVTPEQEQEGDAKLQREAQDLRQRQAQEAISRRYIEQSGKYFSRDAGNRLAFEDVGTSLKTRDSDPYTASSMAMAAQAKGWGSIKVSGDLEFKRAVWMEAQLRGIGVKGYTPTDVDKAALQDRQAKQSRNLVEPARAADKAVPAPARAIMDKAAEAVVGAKVKDPNVRSAVLNVIKRQLDGMEKAGKPIPPVKMYDPKAAPSRQQEPSITRDRSAERSR